jgi:type IV pilus assembly protein PilO
MKKSMDSYSAKMQPFFETVGKLTMIQRLLIGVAVFSLLIGAFVMFSVKPQFEEISKTEKKIKETENKLNDAKKKASELEGWKEKWSKKQEEFEIVMNALPDKQEIPSLLGEISAAGRNTGLTFNRFAPQGEIARDFYAEIPVAISISGTYDRLTLFFKKVADMSRVVNIKNINMAMGSSGGGGGRGKKGRGGGSSNVGSGQINAECTAVTYRFLSEDEKKAQNKGGKKGRKGKRH